MPLADPDKLNMEVKVYGQLAALGGEAQDTVTTLHYIRTNNPAAYSGAAFITAFHTHLKATWLAAVCEHWTWVKTTIRVINSPVEAEHEVAVDEDGALEQDALPGQNAVVMSKKSVYRGRKYAGRAFIAGIGEDSTTGNAIEVATAKPLWDALATKLKQSVTDANGIIFVPAILSRSLSDLGRDTDPAVVTMTQISNVICRSVLGSMDTRKSRVA